MSTNQTPTEEGSVRIAIGNLLRDKWRPENALGLGFTTPKDNGNRLDIHLGNYDEDTPVPQIALRDVSEMPTGSQGYAAIKATGEGPIQDVRGRRDINIYVGKQGGRVTTTQIQEAAKTIGNEVRSIIHDNVNGVMDPATGELLAEGLACSPPRVVPDPDLPETEWRAICEVTFTRQYDPPNR